MDEVKIYILHTSIVKDNLSFISSFVNEQRKERAERYLQEKDRLLSYGAGYLLKKYLPSEDFKETSSGKPYLEDGPCFNVSHSGEYVVLAIHPNRDIGVDIERINEKKLDTIRYVLNEEEKKIEDIESLFRIWSNKESLIKCLSLYLLDIKTASGLPLEGLKVVKDKDYYCKSMIYDNYSLSVTLKGKEPFDLVINRINNL